MIVVVVILAYFKELQVTSFDPSLCSIYRDDAIQYYLLMFLISTSSHYGNAKCRDSHDYWHY